MWVLGNERATVASLIAAVEKALGKTLLAFDLGDPIRQIAASQERKAA